MCNRHDGARIAALVHPTFTFRGSLGLRRTGADDFAAYVDLVHAALGGHRCEILALVVEGHRACARMRFSGVRRAALLGYAAPGRSVEWAGAALFTFAGDRITDLWVRGGLEALWAQLETQVDG